MPHKPFHIYPRLNSKGKNIWYVRFYDESGNRMTARSTGQTSKGAAETWAHEQLKKGIIPSQKNISFGKYAEDWWIWDKCSYVKTRLARGRNLSRRYVDEQYTLLHRHILPYFKNIKLDKINKRMIENWILKLSEKPGKSGRISPITINRIITCFGIMLNRAVELEYIHRNPLKGIVKLKEKPKERGIFTLDEIKILFSDESIVTVWEGELKHFVANMLPLTTGMRQGEVLALQIQNIHDNYISVLHGWSKKYGLIEPKWGSKRHIPIPTRTTIYLNKLIDESPYQQPEDFIFWSESREKPLTDKIIASVLYKAMKNIGIEEVNRRERNLSYHSWRHTFNTLMRGRIADVKLQKLTGHRTMRMVDNYTHFRIEDFTDVLKIQEEYFK